MPDIFTKSKRSEVMSKIRSQNTKLELRMKEALKNHGIRFKFQPKLFGRPDFLIGKNLVVFLDSAFWHGKNWPKLKRQLSKGKHGDYWVNHIAKNRERDRKVTAELRKQGFSVLRIWDDEIKENLNATIKKILTRANE